MKSLINIRRYRGEFIQSARPGEPAARAGLQAGDVVLAVDDQDVTREQSLAYLVANIPPGRRINLQVLRNGRRMTLPLTVGRRPNEDELAQRQFDRGEQDQIQSPTTRGTPGVAQNSLGVQVIPLTSGTASQLSLAAGTRGVVVAAVDPGSDASSKGLTRGTVIVGAGGQEVNSPTDLEAAVAAARSQGRAAVLLRVITRGGLTMSVPVRLR